MNYKIWNGASAIIIQDNKVLMVRGKGTDSWGVPSGEIEEGETAQDTCIREIFEETGYKAEILELLHKKETIIKEYQVTTQYFLCKITGGEISYHDPDNIIVEIAWKDQTELAKINHDYPEDKGIIEKLLSSVA